MIRHVCVGTNDIERSQRFYDAIFATIGVRKAIVDAPKARFIYAHAGHRFIVTTPINGEAAAVGNGGTVGFTAHSLEEVDAWYAAGLAHGGTSCEDPPGLRAASNLYLAYLRDPDGNKLCACYTPPG